MVLLIADDRSLYSLTRNLSILWSEAVVLFDEMKILLLGYLVPVNFQATESAKRGPLVSRLNISFRGSVLTCSHTRLKSTFEDELGIQPRDRLMVCVNHPEIQNNPYARRTQRLMKLVRFVNERTMSPTPQLNIALFVFKRQSHSVDNPHRLLQKSPVKKIPERETTGGVSPLLERPIIFLFHMPLSKWCMPFTRKSQSSWRSAVSPRIT